jgi:hypothetical protein
MRSLRLAVQDVALSRRKQGFESPRERHFSKDEGGRAKVEWALIHLTRLHRSFCPSPCDTSRDSRRGCARGRRRAPLRGMPGPRCARRGHRPPPGAYRRHMRRRPRSPCGRAGRGPDPNSSRAAPPAAPRKRPPMGRIAPLDEHDAVRIVIQTDDQIDGEQGGDGGHGVGRWALGVGGVGRWALGVGRWALGVGRWALGVGRWALGVGRWALGVGRWALGVGRWALGVGRWALGVGRWALGVGRWALGVGRWALGVGRWALGVRRQASGVRRQAGV